MNMKDSDYLTPIQLIKMDIISIFGEDFYEIYVKNSDGVSGSKNIKELFTPKEIEHLSELFKSMPYLELEEKYRNSPMLENLNKILIIILTLKEKADHVILNSVPCMKQNYEELEKIAIKRMNKKNGESLTKDQWLVKIPDLNDTLKSLISKKWNNAYQENYLNSINEKYWKFEEQMITNVFRTTIQYF